MTPASVRDYLATLRSRYTVASRALKHQILDELCATAHYSRKGAIRALNHTPVPALQDQRGHPLVYPPAVRIALTASGKRPGTPGLTASKRCCRCSCPGRASASP